MSIRAVVDMKYTSYWDKQSKVFVAKIPALGLMTQARTEERLARAVQSAATMWLQICLDRGLIKNWKEKAITERV